MPRKSPRPFTPEDDKYLEDHYLTTPLNRIANYMGRHRTVLHARLKRMGLVIPQESLIRFKKEFGSFQQGHTPFNKGKKMKDILPSEKYNNLKFTFRKGHTHNTKPVGYISTSQRKDNGRFIVKIKVAPNKWELLHIHNWKFVNGDIPEGHVLACKDGDTRNCDPANWELITKKEARHRNSAPEMLKDNYVAHALARKNESLRNEIMKHPELIQVKRQQILLNRQINNCAKL